MTAFGLVKKKKIRKVMRLFVYCNYDELNDFRVKKLIHFHNVTNGFECRVLKFDEYTRLREDARLNHITGTFAIYGKAYLYTEQMATINKIIGHYSKNDSDIQIFTKFFDRCWGMGKKIDVSNGVATRITIDNIFDKGWTL